MDGLNRVVKQLEDAVTKLQNQVTAANQEKSGLEQQLKSTKLEMAKQAEKLRQANSELSRLRNRIQRVNSKRRGPPISASIEAIEEFLPATEGQNGATDKVTPGVAAGREPVQVIRVRVVLPRDIKAHVEAGKAGLVDMTAVATLQIHRDEPVGMLLKRVNEARGWDEDYGAFGVYTTRPLLPWKVVQSASEETPFGQWLADLLSIHDMDKGGEDSQTAAGQGEGNALQTTDLPATVDLFSQWARVPSNLLFVKVYRPREKTMEYKWEWFRDDTTASVLLDWMHFWAGLPPKTPLQLWRESTPGELTPIKLAGAKQLLKQGINHGDILVYQEHSTKLPAKMPTAKDFLAEGGCGTPVAEVTDVTDAADTEEAAEPVAA